ncbi:MAG: Ig-like domain-containing protein [Bacteroidaceae bacterium]|nr:Ig-like domain-containing protein [Bacteroidaceae bacterium]
MNCKSIKMCMNYNTKLECKVYYDDDQYSLPIEWSSDNTSVATVDGDGNVTAISIGTANIIAVTHSKLAKCTITVVNESEISHDYIDLGLSVKWATTNVGAAEPEGYGGSFAWGEIELKSTYDWSSYKWCNGSRYTLTKYNTNSSFGTVDNRITLDQEDDVAHVKWGGNWRMPTAAELEELKNECTWTWITLNGVNGYLVTSNKTGYTDRSIFLPAAGIRKNPSNVGSTGYYWSNSLDDGDPGKAYYIGFSSGDKVYSNYSYYNGMSVRPVCP